MSRARRITAALFATVALGSGLAAVQATQAHAVYPCKLQRVVNFSTDRAFMQTHPYNGGICTYAAVRHRVQPPSSGGAHWTSWYGYAGTPGWYTVIHTPSAPNLVYGQTCRSGTSIASCERNPDSTFTNTAWRVYP